MRLDPWVVVAIVAMAAATYLNRAGGYWLFRAFPPPAVVRKMLAYVPGALFVSYVVPKLAAGGPEEWAGAAVTVLAMKLTGNLAITILAGTATAWAVWSLA